MSSIKLNIFEYYKQKNSIPIENNMTRNLAIVLKECPAVLNALIIKIHDKLKESFQNNLSIESYTEDLKPIIILQKSVKKIINKPLYFDEIIGVTLTTELLPLKPNNKTTNSTVNPIPDLIINYRNKLYIIEVKNDKTNASQQLNQQISSLILNYETFDNITPMTTHIPWQEVIEIMYETKDRIENSNFILNEYISHIEHRMPKLTKIKNFEKIAMRDDIQFLKRMKLVGDNMYGDDNRYVVSKDYVWFDIEGIDYLKRITVSNKNDYSLIGHLANNITQGYSLYNEKTKSFLDYNEIEIGEEKFKIIFYPYIKVSNSYGSYIGEIPIDNSNEKFKYSEIVFIFEKIKGRYNKNHDLNDILSKINFITDELSDINIDINQLRNVLNETRYNVITLAVSIKFEILDIGNYLQKIDENYSIGSKDDPISNFILSSGNYVKTMIEESTIK